MKASELRFGNYVVSMDEEPEVFTIDAIDYVEETFHGNALEHVKVDNVCGIPLDETWFELLGFEYQVEAYKGWYSPEIDGLSIRIFKADKQGYKYHSAPKVIICVHELQNLYFALTGEELEKKPKS